MKIRHAFACLAMALAAVPALAFERPFPDTAKRGTMTPDIYPAVVIDGKPRTLAAGARIWNQDNLIEQPATLRAERVVVNYTVDASGDIDRIWILTQDEVRQTIKAQTSK